MKKWFFVALIIPSCIGMAFAEGGWSYFLSQPGFDHWSVSRGSATVVIDKEVIQITLIGSEPGGRNRIIKGKIKDHNIFNASVEPGLHPGYTFAEGELGEYGWQTTDPSTPNSTDTIILKASNSNVIGLIKHPIKRAQQGGSAEAPQAPR